VNVRKYDWEIVLVVFLLCGNCTAQQAVVAKKSIECVEKGGTWHAANACSSDYCERAAK
jgi:hypothetical protein